MIRGMFCDTLVEDVSDVREPKSPVTPKAHPARPRRHVLVADDDPSIRTFLLDYLEQAGFTVRTVGDGMAALDLFSTEPFDIVLLDFQMPGLTGLETAAAIRRKHLTVPIALITGVMYTLDPQLVSQAGVTRTFQKPFDLDDLRTWLESLPGAS